MILGLLLFLFFISTYKQRYESRLAAIIYLSFAVAHMPFQYVSDANYHIYYISAIIFNISAFFLLTRLTKSCGIAHILAIACIISACINFCGWRLWYWYYPPNLYNDTFVLFLMVLSAVLCYGVTSGGNKRGGNMVNVYNGGTGMCRSISRLASQGGA
jgi:small-conductance mechanosensitive channel